MDEMADDVIELLGDAANHRADRAGRPVDGGYVALSLAARTRSRPGIDVDGYEAAADTPEAAQGRETTARPSSTGQADSRGRCDAAQTFQQADAGGTAGASRADAGRDGADDAPGDRRALRGMAERPDRRADLAGIWVPTLILVGEDDVITPPAEAKSMADAIPNAGSRSSPARARGSLRESRRRQRRHPPILEEPGERIDGRRNPNRSSPRRHSRRAGRPSAGERPICLDTEFVSEDTFEPVLCLIQVATRERLAVIDPWRSATRSLLGVVHDPSVQIVMHAAGEDLRICLLRTGSLPRRVFDVQMAAGFVGLSYPLSLVNLVGQVRESACPAAKPAPIGGSGR